LVFERLLPGRKISFRRNRITAERHNLALLLSLLRRP